MAARTTHPEATPAAADDTITITLGRLTVRVPELSLGQRRRLLSLHQRRATAVKAIETGTPDPDALLAPDDLDALMAHTFEVAELLFEEANPPIADIAAIRCSIEDLRRACMQVQEFSGLAGARAETPPGKPPAKPAR